VTLPTPEQLIELYGLQPLEPEGGLFRQTYRSAHGTAILFLLRGDAATRTHRLHADELYHFYLGDPVALRVETPDGDARTLLLGQDALGGQRVQALVAAGCWQSASVPSGGWALLGTTMAPGYDPERCEFR
jgi:predicted cupin superfamily sugar epimerase